MLLEPGDLQFCYNHTLLHDRCAFQDHPEVRFVFIAEFVIVLFCRDRFLTEIGERERERERERESLCRD